MTVPLPDDLAHELWAMSQGPQPIADAVASIAGLLSTFEAACRADERERCAKICDVTPPEPFRPSIEAAHAIRNMEQT